MSKINILKISDGVIFSKGRFAIAFIALIWFSLLSCDSKENVTTPDPDPPPQYTAI